MNISRIRKDHGVEYGLDEGSFHKHTFCLFAVSLYWLKRNQVELKTYLKEFG